MKDYYIKNWEGELININEHQCRYFEQYEMDGDRSRQKCLECGEYKKDENEEVVHL